MHSITSYLITHLQSNRDIIFGLDIWELLVAVFGAIFVAYAAYNLSKRKRIDEFRANYASLNYNRSMYSDNMLEAYFKACGNGETVPELERGAHLLKPALGDRSPWDLLVDVRDIRLEPEFVCTDFRGVSYIGCRFPDIKFMHYRWRFLPNPMRLYSYNIRRYMGKKVFNGGIYHVTAVEADGESVTINVGLSNYYSYYNSCEMLAFLSVCHQNRVLEGRWFQNYLMGDRLDRMTSKLLIDIGRFDNRCVGIGVCTLTVVYGLEDADGMYFLVHHRAGGVSEAMNTISLVPAGSLQPNNGTDDIGTARMDIWYNIMREFEEEVLGRRESESTDRFAEGPINGMKGYYLTMGLDPLTTKMEMVTMLTLDCSSVDVRDYIRGLVPEVADSPLDSVMFRDILRRHASAEGAITMEPLTRNMVDRFERYDEAMPVFRECMRYVCHNFDEIERMVQEGSESYKSS